MVVLARRPAANQLESIVITTGGEVIDEIGTREIAEYLGGTGGFVPANNTGIVQGVRGGWQIPLSNFGVNPGVGAYGERAVSSGRNDHERLPLS